MYLIKKIFFCNSVLVVLLLSGCNSNRSTNWVDEAPLITSTFEDDLGEKVALRQKPNKVISLAPNITEMIYALQCEDQLIAVSSRCDYPEAAKYKRKISTYPEINLEELSMLQAELILATSELFTEKNLASLRHFNLPVYTQQYGTFEDIYRHLGRLGEMLEADSIASVLVDSLQRIENKIISQSKNRTPYRVMLLISTEPLVVAGGGSFLNGLITKAGGKNVFGNNSEAYPIVSPEAVLKAAPEYLILPAGSEAAYQRFMSKYQELYLRLPAARDNKVFAVDPDLLLRPGPRSLEGLYQLAKTLHPNVEVDVFF